MQKGKLYLIPNFLFAGNKDDIASNQLKIIYKLTEFIVESEKSARAFLKAIEHPAKQDIFLFHIYNEHNQQKADFYEIFKNCISGNSLGLISDAGIPCVADPGSIAVSFAIKNNIEIVPMSGSSSIFLALMASGLNGQNFTFNGYLPHEPALKVKKINSMEKEMLTNNHTQIFIETPYRNQKLLEILLKNLNDNTILFIAAGISTEKQLFKQMKIKEWKKQNIEINKIPAIFIIGK